VFTKIVVEKEGFNEENSSGRNFGYRLGITLNYSFKVNAQMGQGKMGDSGTA
jgi:hypothetical protein